MYYIASRMFCCAVRCTVSYCCKLRKHFSIWQCLFCPRSTTHTERPSKHALSPSHALFSYNYPRVEKKNDLCIAWPPRFRNCGNRLFAVSCVWVRPALRIKHFSQCDDFSEILFWGEFYKKICRHVPFLVTRDWKRGPALCANPRHYVSATVNKWKTPMG